MRALQSSAAWCDSVACAACEKGQAKCTQQLTDAGAPVSATLGWWKYARYAVRAHAAMASDADVRMLLEAGAGPRAEMKLDANSPSRPWTYT